MARRKGSLGERVGDVSIARAGVQVGFFVFLLVQLFKEGVWVVFSGGGVLAPAEGERWEILLVRM